MVTGLTTSIGTEELMPMVTFVIGTGTEELVLESSS